MGTTNVYYATGTHIRAVRKTGGLIVAIETTDTDVTALFVRPATNSSVYWGESNGSVRSLVFGLPIRHTYQQPPQAEDPERRLRGFVGRMGGLHFVPGVPGRRAGQHLHLHVGIGSTSSVRRSR